MTKTVTPQRCHWVSDDPLYIAYHDHEWGRPEHDENRLFEMLCLEGQQAGLSWITVLRKRAHYRRVFFDFSVARVAAMSDADIEALLQDAGVVRHRGKLTAIRDNARATQTMHAQGQTLDAYIWGFVGDTPLPKAEGPIPAATALSEKISRDLKKRGFRFVGATTVYAFMQAIGMVNDHAPDCFCR